MRHIRFITLLACLSATLFANAAYTLGTVNLLNDGNSIKAEALYDLDGRTVIIGNGQNACISQYTQGTLTIPGEIDIDLLSVFATV